LNSYIRCHRDILLVRPLVPDNGDIMPCCEARHNLSKQKASTG
jgi:hypothetical protein